MKTVEIPLEITYLNANLSPAEKFPILNCYLDARFERQPSIVKLGSVGSKHQVSVKGSTNNLSKELDPLTSLCFASMSWRLNEFGSPCLLDNGVNYITFGEVESQIKQNGSFTKDLPLIMHTAQNLIKGTIRIQVSNFNYSVQSEVLRGHLKDLRPENPGKIVDAYVQLTMKEEESLGDMLKGTERMRMPFYFGENGFQMGYALPAIAYVLAEIPKSNLMYWENAFQNTMDRNDYKDFKSLDLEQKARITILTICYAAQFLDYVGDTVDRNVKGQAYRKDLVEAYENFGDALATWSGDCEDLACMILQCYNAFVDFKFKSEPFLEMQKIANAYVPALSLDIVHGAQVSDQTESYGAHMNVNFIPLDLFERWLGKEKGGKYQMEGLPFLVGEGTGMYEPLGYDFSGQMNAMRYVYGGARSLEQFKKPILHKRNEPGNFFVGSLVGMTDYYYRRGQAKKPMGFWYMTGKKRGARYEQMMPGETNGVSIRPHPTIPDDVMRVIEAVILKRVPPKPLYLTKGVGKTSNYLDQVVKETKRRGDVSVPVFIRPHQLTRELVEQMKADFQRLDKIKRITYKPEQITDEIWGYKMMIEI